MKEDLLHYLWQSQAFQRESLLSTQGEPLQILSAGIHNHDAGPDFLHAKIQIGPMIWSGSVEIHIKASDWLKHQHQQDPAYDTVILHVVWEADQPVSRTDGTRIPTLTLKNRIDLSLLARYQRLFSIQLKRNKSIVCQPYVKEKDALLKLSTMEAALVRRMENKSGQIHELLHSNQGDWQTTLYQWTAQAFGFKVNAVPFLALSKAVPLTVLRRLNKQLSTYEALMLGQAGFLEQEFEDAYLLNLQKEYLYQAKKYQLQPLQVTAHLWKFSRLRPANFPTLRIAQWTGFLFAHLSDMSTMLEEREVEQLKKIFSFSPSLYWQKHYHFHCPTPAKFIGFGKDSVSHMLINVVAPIQYAFGKFYHREARMEEAINLLTQLPAEKNTITQQYQSLDFPMLSAFDSQAVIELHNSFCKKHLCLQCKIGLSIMKSAGISVS